MTLLIIVFSVTMVLSAGTYLVVTKTLQQRDSSKLKERLSTENNKKKKNGPGTAPLFEPDGEKSKTLITKVLARFNLEVQLQRAIEQAGLSWAPGQFCVVCLLLALLAFNLSWYVSPVTRGLAILFAPAAGLLPWLYLKRKRTKRIRAFEAQFPDALQFIARAMRAGHAFSVALEMLYKEFSQPLAGEFRRTFEEQNLGLPMDAALEKLAYRVPTMDLRFFVAAVLLQKRTGGNLAEILDNLAGIIRERFKLRGQIRSISAHGRLSSIVLTAIPAVVALMMTFVHPEHIDFFIEEEMGQWMAGLAIGFQGIGYFVMSRIVRIEV